MAQVPGKNQMWSLQQGPFPVISAGRHIVASERKVISDFNPGLCLKHCPNGKNSEKKSPERDHSDDEWEFPDPKENEQRRHKMLSRLARLEAELAQLKCELDAGK